MSLGKLLATGRSLVGGAPAMGRYDISERNRLPKFGSAKNPFAPSATSEPKAAAPAEVNTEPTPAPVGQAETVDERIAELVRVTESVCQPPAPMVAPAPSPFSQTQRLPKLEAKGILGHAGVVVGWLVQMCSLIGRFGAVAGAKGWQLARGIKWGAFPRTARSMVVAAWTKTKLISTKLVRLVRKRDPQQVFPRLGKPAVQTELSLDNVHVVRNSLEDSDLEIVTAETSTSSQVAPTKPVAAPNRGPVPVALKKITGPLGSVKALQSVVD